MKYILNNSLNPYFNLALEEHIFKTVGMDDDFIILWQNDKTIVIGRHQNTIEEVNSDFVKENNINVVRRITGGGAVYHDLGNLNFSFITGYDKNDKIDYKKYTIPVINALDKIGIKAELSGRNDLTIDGKKFSGNAQSLHKGRILHHGTLLFNSDLDVVSKALNVKADKIKSKGIKSVRSRVTNISDYLDKSIEIGEFKDILLKNLFEENDLQEYIITEDDLKAINELKDNKYNTWEWIYGKSPKFNFKSSKWFTNGNIEVLLNVKGGIITDCKIYGDFLALYGIDEVEKNICGLQYEENVIENLIKSFDLVKYFGNITLEEVLSCFFN
ncbi:lipoate--protein ligase [Clostridium sp. CX1]|uniref:lipoate--protein ligase n=1 Tax=Clostridium tanneri TaxID=3037988 RepID=A0ABU4JPC5_9CLOT|nr:MULTISPECIES: lipoate--protein ligase [unclassified Clostridium]MCT8976348.1 lipoate--protein ligase [Clostridium sp. CX1]MDW8800012.1 lipoate--protein ligase [Clostridium sp. A1-XYC3]